MTINLFSSSKIKKYYKNQVNSKDTCLMSKSYSYIDEFFPPNEESITGFDKENKEKNVMINEKININEITWMTANHIFSEIYTLFSLSSSSSQIKSIHINDIKQGGIGNCYFISSLASLSIYPTVIYNLFRTYEINQEGYYEVILFINGDWQVVVLDNYFPVYVLNSTFLVFSRSNHRKIWSILIEKAWAKVNSGYMNIKSGYENEALEALTGFPSERYVIEKSFESYNDLWEYMIHAYNKKNIMCVTTIDNQSIKERGLVPLHAYTLIEVIEIDIDNTKIRLLKIRNPWGYNEWNGEWSREYINNMRIKYEKSLFALTSLNEGEFYMEFNDFIMTFGYLSHCCISSSSVIKHLTYKSSSAYPFCLPKVYIVELFHDDSQLGISIIDRHWRFSRDVVDKVIPLYSVLCQVTENDELKYISSKYSVNTSISIIKNNLNKGKYLLWIWNDYENSYISPDNDKAYSVVKINLASDKDFSIEDKGFDIDFDILKSLIYYSNIKTIEVCQNKCFNREALFDQSGFGYLLIVNKSNNVIKAVIDWQQSLLQEMNYVKYSFSLQNENEDEEKNKGKQLIVNLSKNASFCLIVNRLSMFKKFSFSIKTDFSYMSNQEFLIIKPEFDFISNTNKFIKIINYNLNSQSSYSELIKISNDNDNDLNSYSYIYSSLFKLNSSSDSSDESVSNDIEYSILKSKYPKEFSIIEKYLLNKKMNKIQSSGKKLFWIYYNFNNGYYIGEMNNKLDKEGVGIYVWDTGIAHCGYWKDSHMEGYGEQFKIKEKDFVLFCKGDFIRSKLNGQCQFYYESGDYIICDVINGVKSGSGVYFWKNGSRWEGGFVNNQLNGVGIMYDYNNKEKGYVVEYINGKRV